MRVTAKRNFDIHGLKFRARWSSSRTQLDTKVRGYAERSSCVRPAAGATTAALEEGPDRGMGLVALELLEGAEIRVRVAQAHDEPQGDLALHHVIHEGSAVGRAVERPARRVDHEPGHMLFRGDFPELLET